MPNDISTHTETLRPVRAEVREVFSLVDLWFDKAPAVRAYRPSDLGWTIDEVLEHITLTSHFLLIVIRNSTRKAIKRAARGEMHSGLPESDLDLLQPVGHWGSFTWTRPEHMEPRGQLSLEEVRTKMHAQRDECLSILDELCQGQGALFTVRMSVNDSGRLDIYQWMYFLALHARRHLFQMERNEAEYNSGTGQ